MNTALVQSGDNSLGTLETVLATGDLSKLSTEDRTRYLLKVCDSLGLNPLTRPFQYVTLSGRLTLYATRDATDQLRKLHGVSVRITSRERTDDLCIIQAEATDRTGRTDTSIGVLSIKGMSGEALANALMKCETKAKRRVTLSICGLGMLDETEVATVPDMVPVAQPPVSVSEVSASAGAPIPPLPAKNLTAAPTNLATHGVQYEQAKGREALPRQEPAKPAAVKPSDAAFERFWTGVRKSDSYSVDDIQAASDHLYGQPVRALSAAQLLELANAVHGTLLSLDDHGRWIIVEPPAEPKSDADLPLGMVGEIAAAVR